MYFPLGRKKTLQCSHVKNSMASNLHGQPVSPSKYFKSSGLEGQKEVLFTLHGLLGEHTVALLVQLSTLDIDRHSLVRDEHLSPQ